MKPNEIGGIDLKRIKDDQVVVDGMGSVFGRTRW